jgi:Domain of unknown function (DUF4351)
MTTPLDVPWKQILENYFPQFMAFFFPAAHDQIDWSKGFEFLDVELQQVTREAETGKRIVDKLAKVFLLDGRENWILLHVEIQNQKEEGFGQRIHIYSGRLFDKFQKPVASFAVLGDTDTNWRPDHFTIGALGSTNETSFQIAKLLDWEERPEELAASNNPFAFVVQAHLAAQATARKTSQKRRRQQKYLLTTMLYKRGWSRQEIIDLYRFLDWVLTLPPELEAAYQQDLKTYEEENNMAYISSIERTGEARGEERGITKGAFTLVSSLMHRQLGEIPEATNETVKGLSIDQLEQLALDLSNFKSIADLTDWLDHL